MYTRQSTISIDQRWNETNCVPRHFCAREYTYSSSAWNFGISLRLLSVHFPSVRRKFRQISRLEIAARTTGDYSRLDDRRTVRKTRDNGESPSSGKANGFTAINLASLRCIFVTRGHGEHGLVERSVALACRPRVSNTNDYGRQEGEKKENERKKERRRSARLFSERKARLKAAR